MTPDLVPSRFEVFDSDFQVPASLVGNAPSRALLEPFTDNSVLLRAGLGPGVGEQLDRLLDDCLPGTDLTAPLRVS